MFAFVCMTASLALAWQPEASSAADQEADSQTQPWRFGTNVWPISVFVMKAGVWTRFLMSFDSQNR